MIPSSLSKVLSHISPFTTTPSPATPSPATAMPDEVLPLIFVHCHLAGINACQRVCRQWEKAAQQPDIWKVVAERLKLNPIDQREPKKQVQTFSETAPGCAVVCAAAMPRPRDDPTFQHCQNTVLKGTFNGQNYRFTLLKKADETVNHERAYLYIDFTDDNYPGFGKAEKRDLKAIGIREVKLFGTHPDGRNYVELTKDLIPIEELKSRNTFSTPSGLNWSVGNQNSSVSPPNDYPYQTGYKRSTKVPTSGADAVWVILIIIIILVVIFLIWYWVSRSRNYSYYANNKKYGMNSSSGYAEPY